MMSKADLLKNGDLWYNKIALWATLAIAHRAN